MFQGLYDVHNRLAKIDHNGYPLVMLKTIAKAAQKDVDTSRTKKNGRSYYAYKNHILINAKKQAHPPLCCDGCFSS